MIQRNLLTRATAATFTLAAPLMLAATAAAQTAPVSHLYDGPVFAVWKVVALFIIFALLAAIGNWVAKDALMINRQTQLWYAMFVGAATLAVVVVLAVPIFVLGLILALALIIGPTAYYVTWRNERVPPEHMVFTSEHLRHVAMRILKKDQSGEIAADRAVHVAAASHLNENYKLLYLKTNDFPIHLTPADEEEKAAFAAGEKVIFEALSSRAEQITIDPAGKEFLIRYRVDEAVRDGGKLDKKTGDGAITFIKRLAELDVAERRKPQTGRFIVLLNDQGTTAVVQTSGSVKGEHLEARLYDQAILKMRLLETGMRQEQVDLFHRALDQKTGGVILMSGPPRSGRTVSTYAAVRELDLYSRNVIAVEQEIGIDVQGINQVEVDKNSGATLAETVQNVLRGDPDVVMVEDVPDADTARMILLGAAAGKTMIAGLSANDVTETIRKFMVLADDPQSVSSALLAVTNQRLMRTLCTGCREAYRPQPEFLRKANLENAKVDVLYREPKTRPADKKGETIICPICHNEGYTGRTAVYETIVLDDNARQLLTSGGAITELRTELRKEGQEFLQEEALRKVVAGVTSVSELLRVLKPSS